MYLFCLKSILGNYFTRCCLFGCAWKFWSNGKSFPLIVKYGWLKCKIDYKSILPSKHFPKKNKNKKSTEPREREREGLVTITERESETKPPTVRERKVGHLNLRSMAPPSEPCLSLITNHQPSSIHPTLVTDPPFPHHQSPAITYPPLPHHRSTPPSASIHEHPRPTSSITSHASTRQVELRSWQPTTGHALSSPPKTNLVVVAEDRRRLWRPVSLSLNLSIFLSLISDFFVVVMVVWVVVFQWFLCCVVVGFVWIVVDFLWVLVYGCWWIF